MNKKLQTYLLSISRQTIVDYFTVGKKLALGDESLPSEELAQKAATFVTLTQESKLRGCVGNIIARRKMYEDVINNSLLAAFGDPRFSPLKEDEVNSINIEISVLSAAKRYVYSSVDELLGQIKEKEHGIILQQQLAQATFLPQVWRELPTKQEFLEALSQKAGLEKDAWKSSESELFYYTVEEFSE